MYVCTFTCKASAGACMSQCHYLDAQELSWPIQSRTLSVMTFCKERWQSNQQSTDHPEEFQTLRYILTILDTNLNKSFFVVLSSS